MKVEVLSTTSRDIYTLSNYFATCDFLLRHALGKHKFIYLTSNRYMPSLLNLDPKFPQGTEYQRGRVFLNKSKNYIGRMVQKLQKGVPLSQEDKDRVDADYQALDGSEKFSYSDSGDLLIDNAIIYRIVPDLKIYLDKNVGVEAWIVPSRAQADAQLNSLRKSRKDGTGGKHFKEIIDMNGTGVSRKDLYYELEGSIAKAHEYERNVGDKTKGKNLETVVGEYVDETNGSYKIKSDFGTKTGIMITPNIPKSQVIFRRQGGSKECEIQMPHWLLKIYRETIEKYKKEESNENRSVE